MGLFIDVGRCARVLAENPSRVINLSQRVALHADVQHKNGAMGPGWYVVTRLIDKTNGSCFLASSAPWPQRSDKYGAIRSAVMLLRESL